MSVTQRELRKYSALELKKVLDITKFARKKLADGWIKGADARTKTGKHVDVTNRYATQFCAMGAIKLATKRICGFHSIFNPFISQEKVIKWVIPISSKGYSIMNWNDSYGITKLDVLDAFDSLIYKVSNVLSKKTSK